MYDPTTGEVIKDYGNEVMKVLDVRSASNPLRDAMMEQ